MVPWIDGQDVADLPTASRSDLVEDLADVLLAIHRPAPAGAPHNPFRGVSVASRRDEIAARIEAWDGPRSPLRRAWARAGAAEPYAGPPLWPTARHTAEQLVADFG